MSVNNYIKSFVLIDSNPVLVWKKLKEEFFKFTFNSEIFSNIWDNNKFDGKIVRTQEWFDTDNEETFLRKGNKEYEGVKITYDMNEYGFRTNHKTNDLKKDKKIACFGCSHTFGEGLPWEETWPYVLNQMMGEEWDVRNYGIGGSSNDMMARLIYNYTIKNKPDYICVYFAETLRAELYDPQGYEFSNFLPTDMDEISKWKHFDKWKTYRAYRTLANEENGISNFIKNFKFIDEICKNRNIPWYWGTWSIPILFSPEGFIKTHLNVENYCKPKDDIESYLDEARDGGHFGKKTCKEIAKSFFEKINYDNKILG